MATIAFGDAYTLGEGQFSLIQLPLDLFKKVQDDPTVTFRMKGRENEEAVLVTENQTFVVRRGETSNTQMLFECSIESLIGLSDVGDGTCRAVGNIMNHMELVPASARLHELPGLLARRPYDGPDLDAEFEMEGAVETRLNRSEIEGMVQASGKEIDVELDRLGALDIFGSMCTMGQRYESNLMTNIFSAAVINTWDLSSISLEQCLADKDVATYPKVIVSTFLAKYAAPYLTLGGGAAAEPSGAEGGAVSMEVDGAAAGAVADGGFSGAVVVGGAGKEGAGAKRALDLQKMALFRAEELLDALPITQRMSVDDFLARLRTMLPDNAQVSMTLLHGRAIPELKGGRQLIRKLSIDDLPRDVKSLFRVLFVQRATWTREELVPYLARQVGPGQSADQLLLKHTRVTRTPGSTARSYSAR